MNRVKSTICTVLLTVSLSSTVLAGNIGLPRTNGNIGLPRTSGNIGLPRSSGNIGLPRSSGNIGLPRSSGNIGLPRTSNTPFDFETAISENFTTLLRFLLQSGAIF